MGMIGFHCDVVGARQLVPTKRGLVPYINMDNAASTPALQAVCDTVNGFLPWYASVHRGNGLKSRVSTKAYEDARAILSGFVGADLSEYAVLFGKNTTEAINKLSYRLPLKPDDIVLISHMEHHSNDLPWRTRSTVRRIPMTFGGAIDRQAFTALLKRYAGRVRLVAISAASNVTGNVPDIHWFARQAHAAGAYILVDAAQLVAHRPVRMGSLADADHIDFLAMSGHKMYAPFGSGVLIARLDMLQSGIPEYKGGGTVRFVTEGTVDWADLPDRDEAGSPNVVGAVAMARAALSLQEIGFPAIARHEHSLTAYAFKRLAAIPHVVLHTMYNPSAVGVISFSVEGMHHHLVAAILGHEWGIGVRSGCFCAHPFVMDMLHIDRAMQDHVRMSISAGHHEAVPGMVRISFGLYNKKAEIDVLAEALAGLTHGMHDSYDQDIHTGEFIPRDADMRTPAIF